MLRAVLRNFNTTVRMVDNFLLNTFHLIPHYYGIFPDSIQSQLIQHNTTFRLFHGINRISFIPEVINSFNSVINIFPVNGKFGSQSRFMHFRMGWNSRYTAQIDTFNTKSIRSAEYGTYIMQTANIIQYNYQRQFLRFLKLLCTNTIEFGYFQFSIHAHMLYVNLCNM